MKTFDNNFKVILLISSLLLLLLFFLPSILVKPNIFGIDFSATGQIGDTIGGIISPFVAVIAALLTFLAFWVQYKANEQQKVDIKIERFENRLFNLIELHRLNVSELEIGNNLKNRRVFTQLYRELKFIYLAAQFYYNSDNQKNIISNISGDTHLANDFIYKIAYLIFYYGIGPSSTQIIKGFFDEKYFGLILNFEEYLEKIKYSENPNSISIPYKNHNGDSNFILECDYIPFDGHTSRLGPYFRHIFHILKYIHTQDQSIFNQKTKFLYSSTLRNQLSEFEQLILFYHSISILGKMWNSQNNNFIINYCLLKNIPVSLTDFYMNCKEFYPEKNEYGLDLFITVND